MAIEKRQLIQYGSENDSWVDKICALVFALAPLLQHYKGLVENAGFTVLIFITPILLLRTFSKLLEGTVEKRSFFAIVPLILFYLYTLFIRDFNAMRLGYVLLLIWVFICISNGSINISYFFKIATKIAVLATIIIIFQFITHYLFGRTFDFRPLSLLVSQDVIWVKTAETYGLEGYLYRPSGFFLEPSHFFLYTFPIVTVLLLSDVREKKNIRTAVFLSLGLLLSTSGMGIAVMFSLWLLYFAVYRKNDSSKAVIAKLFSVRNVVIFLLFMIMAYLAYRWLPIIQNTVNRVFIQEEGTTNAIDGRVRLAQEYARGISGKAVWIGTPNVVRDLDFNLSGFFATYIKWGIFGLFFSYWFYVQGLFKLKGPYFWMSLIIIIISYFTAHTHGTFYMLYFMMYLMNGYYLNSRSRMSDNTN